MSKKIRISGTGCCLVDRLFNNISFHSDNLRPYLSRDPGDGGLTPGKLVFQEELERFSGKDFQKILREITHGQHQDKTNVGGPAIVALIHAAQITENPDCTYYFYGCRGEDAEGEYLLSSLQRTPVLLDHYELNGDLTPSTVVLSDPDYDQGQGERMFINSIGSAWNFVPEKLDDGFFSSDVVVFGGTALVPRIHENLTGLLKKSKDRGCITLVNTVFDFRSEKSNPGKRWPLGKSDESYRHTDLLIMDREEALRMSGEVQMDEAMEFFRRKGTGAVIITNGSKNIRGFSGGGFFKELENLDMPVSRAVTEKIQKGHLADTTGCGDNFAGGVTASLVAQLENGNKQPDLAEACTWGIISGGYTCFYLGGTYLEHSHGEKRRLILPYYYKYKQQMDG